MIALRNKNIMIDIAGITDLCTKMVYPEIDAKVLIKRYAEVLGANRILYGTDNMDADMNLQLLSETGLSGSDLEKIMGLNAEKYLKLDKGDNRILKQGGGQ